jgi:SAM-dependent methyltransferase
VTLVEGDALALPFGAAAMDLALFENVLLWTSDSARAVAEAARVLTPGGTLVAIEPDYGGMIEEPELGLRAVWVAALERAGADPRVGRRIAGACERAGLTPRVELTHLPQPATGAALALLEGLALEQAERATVTKARAAVGSAATPWSVFVHVPYFVVVAHKPAR